MSLLIHPLGMRMTTWLCVGAFLLLTARRRDLRPVAAAWVWLVGFEATYDVTHAALGLDSIEKRLPVVVLAVVTVGWFSWHGIRPSLWWSVAVVALWSIWIAAGYPVNVWNGHTLTSAGGFDPIAEALNVGTKTALAAAYFWPFVRRTLPSAAGTGQGPRSLSAHPSLVRIRS